MKAFAAKRLNVSPSGHPLVLDSLPAKTPLTRNTSLRFFSSSLSPCAPFLVLLLAIASRELKASTTETQRRFYFPFGQRPRYAAGKNLYGESSPGNGMAYFAFFPLFFLRLFLLFFPCCFRRWEEKINLHGFIDGGPVLGQICVTFFSFFWISFFTLFRLPLVHLLSCF